MFSCCSPSSSPDDHKTSEIDPQKSHDHLGSFAWIHFINWKFIVYWHLKCDQLEITWKYDMTSQRLKSHVYLQEYKCVHVSFLFQMDMCFLCLNLTVCRWHNSRVWWFGGRPQLCEKEAGAWAYADLAGYKSLPYSNYFSVLFTFTIIDIHRMSVLSLQDVQLKVKAYILGTDMSNFKYDDFIVVLDVISRSAIFLLIPFIILLSLSAFLFYGFDIESGFPALFMSLIISTLGYVTRVLRSIGQ